MNDRLFDRLAQEFLADGPTVLADRVYDAAFREVHGMRQRRGALGGLRRWVPEIAVAAISGAAVLMVVVVVATLRGPATLPDAATGAEAPIGDVWTTNDEVSLVVEAPTGERQMPYLAAAFYDEFRLRSWHVSAEHTVVARAAGEALLAGTADAVDPVSRRELTLTVRPELRRPMVFVAYQPHRISSPVQVEVIGPERFLARITRPASSAAYTLTALVPAPEADGGPTEERLRAAGTAYPAGMLERYGRAAVPVGAMTTPEARALLADLVREGGDNPYDLAVAAERLLKDPARFTYDTDVRDVDCADLSIVDCFARYRRGFCEYYASTMAILLRALDIPTRFVEGFLPGEQDVVTGTWTVRDRDAHSWVQVYFPGYGWIDFDPTGGGRATLVPLPPGGPGGDARPVEGS